MKNYSPSLLITGANGQLGCALSQHPLAQEYRIITRSHLEMDITNIASVQHTLTLLRPDIVINTAAYTAVDKAEQDSKEATQVNYLGTHHLAIICEKYQIPLLHISTDYIFDGKKTAPYQEDDAANPLNFYGKSKWMSEQAVREQCQQHIILRVSGVFSEYRNNFLKTMLRLGHEKSELRVVADQITCPTYAGDIASTLYALAKKITAKKPWHQGTYHYCSESPVSWHQFAVAIFEEAKSYKSLSMEEIKAISAAEYPALATRPAYSVLGCSKIKADFDIAQPSWGRAVKQVVAKLMAVKE